MSSAPSPVPQPNGVRYLLRQWWREAQWLVVLAAGSVAIILGFVGWTRYLNSLDAPAGVFDSFYLTIQLFTLQVSGFPEGSGFPIELQLAKFLAPVVAGYAAARALYSVFTETTQQIGVRFARDHAVVVGLDDFGLEVTRRFRDLGLPVVAIASEHQLEALRPAIDMGARVVTGDARDQRLLRRVRLDRCRHVLIHGPDDGVCGQVAATVAQLTAERRSVLDCVVVLDDYRVAGLLRQRDLSARSGPVAFSFVHLDELAAVRLISRFPPAEDGPIVVLGAGRFAEQVVRVLSLRSPGRVVRILSDDASSRVDAWDRNAPGMFARIDIVAVDVDLGRPEEVERAVGSQTGQAYVCDDLEASGLALGLSLADCGVDTVVRLSHADGLSELSAGASLESGEFTAFGYVDAVTDPELLVGGLWEQLARNIHERYRLARLTSPTTAADDPAVVHWAELAEPLRASNRAQARDIGEKIAAIGVRIESVDGSSGPEGFAFEDDEVEQLARREHERWMAERVEAGWRLGDRDPARKRSPDLLPYDQLQPSAQEKDREAVQSIPDLLSGIGYRLVR